MELDELRARWQQALPLPDPPSDLNEAALGQLVVRRPGSPVARLERSARLESGLTVLFILASIAVLLLAQDNYVRTMQSWMLLICLLMLPYYVRQIQLIKRLRDVTSSVSQNTRQQVASIRSLMQLYYLASMWSVPVPFGIGLYFIGGGIMRQPSGPKIWLALSFLVAVHLLVGIPTYFVMRWATRQYLQKRYGQYLDRLEQSLAELEEPVPNFSN